MDADQTGRDEGRESSNPITEDTMIKVMFRFMITLRKHVLVTTAIFCLAFINLIKF